MNMSFILVLCDTDNINVINEWTCYTPYKIQVLVNNKLQYVKCQWPT